MPVSEPRTASRPAACRSRSACPSPPASMTPSSRCSVETNSSPNRRASSPARSSTRRARGSSVIWPPVIFARRARRAASSPRNAARSTPSRRSVWAGIPSSVSTSEARMCSASRTGLWSRSASACAPAIASWAFWVNRSRFMLLDPSGRESGRVASGRMGSGRAGRIAGRRSRSLRRPRVGLVDRVQERCRGHLPRLIEDRQDDADLHVEVAAALALEARHPLAAEPEDTPVLSPGGDPQQDAAGQRPDGHLGADERLAERDRQLAAEGRAVAMEDRVRGDPRDEHEVPRSGALAAAAAAEPDPAPRHDAGGDLDLEPLAVHVDQAGHAVEGVLEAQVDMRLHGRRCGHVAARARPAPRRDLVELGRGPAEIVGHAAGEERPEEVREVGAVPGELEADAAGSRSGAAHPRAPARAGTAVRAGGRREPGEGTAGAERVSAGPRSCPGIVLPVGAQLVVLRPLRGVGEDLVGLVDLLEAALGVAVPGVPVRVVLPGQLPVRLLDLRGRGGLGDAQGLVIVLVLHGRLPRPRWRRARGRAAVSGPPRSPPAGRQGSPAAPAPRGARWASRRRRSRETEAGAAAGVAAGPRPAPGPSIPVSYTHLTLPTKRIV